MSRTLSIAFAALFACSVMFSQATPPASARAQSASSHVAALRAPIHRNPTKEARLQALGSQKVAFVPMCWYEYEYRCVNGRCVYAYYYVCN
jgi:hypothetical protein